MKFYIATGLANAAEHNLVRDALIANGDTITYDWTAHGPVWRSGCEVIAQTAERERLGVIEADFVVVMLTKNGKDRGTHTELGIALAFRKPIVLLSDNPNHFDAHPDTCAFYHATGVRWARTLDEVVATAIYVIGRK